MLVIHTYLNMIDAWDNTFPGYFLKKSGSRIWHSGTQTLNNLLYSLFLQGDKLEFDLHLFIPNIEKTEKEMFYLHFCLLPLAPDEIVIQPTSPLLPQPPQTRVFPYMFNFWKVKMPTSFHLTLTRTQAFSFRSTPWFQLQPGVDFIGGTALII